MSKQKITLVVVAVILIVSAVALGLKIANRDELGRESQSPKARPMGQKEALTPEQVAREKAVQADPDAKALEADLNTINDEDLSTASLSDQNVGL